MMDREQAIEVAKAWLREKHCTLWMNWDIVRPGGLEEAATWLVDTYRELTEAFLAASIG